MWVITLILSILYAVYIVIEHEKLVNERDMKKQEQLANCEVIAIQQAEERQRAQTDTISSE